MRVIIRNPEKIYFEGFAKEAILPGEDGEFSVWDFHQSLISTLRKGNVILNQGKDIPAKIIGVNSGVVTLDRNELMILCL
jgi:F0F1-type ATP synthase epsilon subunit